MSKQTDYVVKLLLASGGLALWTASLTAADNYGKLEPAGEFEFQEDGTTSGLTVQPKSKLGKFSLAQNGETVPPEPKIVTPPSPGGGATNAETGAGEGSTAAPPEGGDAFSDTWESYSDKPEELAADDITRRIRVEDIVEPPSEYHFAAFGKDDPFVPPLLAQEVNAIEVPIISPLQRHPLSSMGLTGVWGGSDGQRKALITVPEFGRGLLGVVVKVGDPIGNSGGKVVAINKDGMTVREFHLAPDGSRIYEDRFLMLGDKPPIPIVSGNVVFRPGDDAGSVVDPIDRNAERGVVVDPQGPVFDRLWQTEQIKSLKQDPAAKQAAKPGPPTAQGPLPGPAPAAAVPQAGGPGQLTQPEQTIPAATNTQGTPAALPMQVAPPAAGMQPPASTQPPAGMQPVANPAASLPAGGAAPAPATANTGTL